MLKNYSRPKTKNRYRKFLFLLPPLLVIGAIVIWRLNDQPAAQAKPTTTPVSHFDFDATKAPDWRRGPGDGTAMVVFYNPADCFVNTSLRPDNQKTTPVADDPNRKKTSALDVRPTVNSRLVNTQIQLYEVNDPSPNPVYPGQGFGMFTTPEGNVDISVYCADPALLGKAADAIKAITYRSTAR